MLQSEAAEPHGATLSERFTGLDKQSHVTVGRVGMIELWVMHTGQPNAPWSTPRARVTATRSTRS